MPQSVYKVIEVIGTSTTSWEEAAKIAVERTGEHLRDLRVAEVVELDLVITDGKVEAYRAKVKVSFKYEVRLDRGCTPSLLSLACPFRKFHPAWIRISAPHHVPAYSHPKFRGPRHSRSSPPLTSPLVPMSWFKT
jgi:flavin-binding protein dodecin